MCRLWFRNSDFNRTTSKRPFTALPGPGVDLSTCGCTSGIEPRRKAPFAKMPWRKLPWQGNLDSTTDSRLLPRRCRSSCFSSSVRGGTPHIEERRRFGGSEARCACWGYLIPISFAYLRASPIWSRNWSMPAIFHFSGFTKSTTFRSRYCFVSATLTTLLKVGRVCDNEAGASVSAWDDPAPAAPMLLTVSGQTSADFGGDPRGQTDRDRADRGGGNGVRRLPSKDDRGDH